MTERNRLLEKAQVAGEVQVDQDLLRAFNDGDLATLRQKFSQMQQDKAELEKKRFLDESLAHFNELMRVEADTDLNEWAQELLNELVPFVDGLQAALYILENEAELGEAYLRRIGGYAVPADSPHQIAFGQGLTGQVARSQEAYQSMEAGHFQQHTKSALAELEPQFLLILPLVNNERTVGVLEVTALHSMRNAQVALLHELSPHLAANLSTLANQVRIRQLYQEAEAREEQMRNQEREMRRHLDELEAAQQEMKSLYEAINQQKSQLDAIFENSGLMITTVDQAGNITRWNRQAEYLLGYSAEEAIDGLNPGHFHLPEEVMAENRRLQSEYGVELAPGLDTFGYLPLVRGEVYRRRWTMLHKDGSHIPMDMVISALQDENGQAVGMIALGIDQREQASRQKALEEELAALRAENHELKSRLQPVQA